DNFTADLGSIAVNGTPTTPPEYTLWSVPLNIAATADATEFRIYFYASRRDGTDIMRIDDVVFKGFGVAPSAGAHITKITVIEGDVVVDFTGGMSDDASVFKLQSASVLDAEFTDDDAAEITGSLGVFQAATTANG